MALIHLAQADPAIAVLVRTEGAESPQAKKAWGVVWDRLSPVTTVIGALALVAVGMHAGAHEALLTALSPLALTAPSIHYAKRRGVRCNRGRAGCGFCLPRCYRLVVLLIRKSPRDQHLRPRRPCRPLGRFWFPGTSLLYARGQDH
nr:DUF3693 domain-containing protein [Xanthomonas citri]